MVCDKCDRDVTRRNSVLILSALIEGIDLDDPWSATVYLNRRDRHLLPVFENGEVICSGSPPSAQYLEGQPRDERFPYDPKFEARWRAAREEQLRRFPEA